LLGNFLKTVSPGPVDATKLTEEKVKIPRKKGRLRGKGRDFMLRAALLEDESKISCQAVAT